jgi:hypothetical protein
MPEILSQEPPDEFPDDNIDQQPPEDKKESLKDDNQDILTLEEELKALKADESPMTQKIIINPQIEEKMTSSTQKEEDTPEEKPIPEKVSTESIETESKSEPDPAILAKVMDSAKPAKAYGIAYIDGNNVSFTGGYKPISGEQLVINDKAFDLKDKPPSIISKIPKPFLIGGGALLILILIAIISSIGSTENGQIVGILTDQSTGLTIPKATIAIEELNRTAETSYAGFFVFDDVPPGIYTIILEDEGIGISSERMTVLENKTSTITLSVSLNGTPSRSSTEKKNRSRP